MSIWFFILLIVVCGMVVGPISMLRPNPAQRRKEQLRSYASKKGLRVSMRQLPTLKTDMDQPAVTPVYYFPLQPGTLEVAEWILMRTRYVHEGNFYAEWDWQTDARPGDTTCTLLKSYLPRLPESVLAISRGRLGVCVFWTEKEGDETVDLLSEMLGKLQQIDNPLLPVD